MTDQTAELIKLIHELSKVRQRMLELESLGLRQSGEVHPTYTQSAAQFISLPCAAAT